MTTTMMVACGPPEPQLGESPIEEVIAAMTLEEKAHLVVGTGMEDYQKKNNFQLTRWQSWHKTTTSPSSQ